MSNNENPISKQVEDDEISINFGEIYGALKKYKILIAATSLFFAGLGIKGITISAPGLILGYFLKMMNLLVWLDTPLA